MVSPDTFQMETIGVPGTSVRTHLAEEGNVWELEQPGYM